MSSWTVSWTGSWTGPWTGFLIISRLIISSFIYSIQVMEEPAIKTTTSKLFITEASLVDSGVYQCNASSKWGHDYSLVHLIVKGIYSLHKLSTDTLSMLSRNKDMDSRFASSVSSNRVLVFVSSILVFPSESLYS